LSLRGLKGGDMYQVGVIVEFEDGTAEQNKFEYWGEACQWVINFANNNMSLPKKVNMWILRKS